MANLDLAWRQASEIVQEVYDQLLLQGYDVKLWTQRGNGFPEVQIKLDQRFLENRYSSAYQDPSRTLVLWWAVRNTRYSCYVRGRKFSYAKTRGGFDGEQIIQAAINEAKRLVTECQEWLIEQTNKASSWDVLERLGQEFGGKEKSGVRMDPDKTQPNRINCHIFLSRTATTVEQALRILSSLPPKTPVNILDNFRLTEEQARPFLQAMQQYVQEHLETEPVEEST